MTAPSAPSFRRGVSRGFALAALFVLCTGRDQASPANGSELEFEFAGCARIRPGPICELGAARTLTVWVAGARPPELDVGNASSATTLESRVVEGGFRVTFAVPERSRRIQLHLGRRHASLQVAENSESSAIRELGQWWKEGKWPQVRARLDQARDVLVGPERDRLRAFRARLSLRDGDNERAANELEATAQSAERAGLLLEASNDRWAASYCLAVRLQQYARASELLERTPAELVQIPEIRARLAFYSGVLAQARGDAQGALVQFRTASVLSRRLALGADELLARQELAATLSRLHRDAEALAEQEAVVAHVSEASSCQLSLSWEDLSWMLLTQPESSSEARTAAALAHAEQLLEHCPDPVNRRNQALNRIAFALQRRDDVDAEARLRALEADETGRTGRFATWQALYWGGLHLLRVESSDAVAAYELAERLAESLVLKECVYLARLGRARALAQRRDPTVVDAYLAAEEAAEDFVRWAPFGQGQQLTALQAQSSARELLTLLLDLGHPREALLAARRAVHRVWAANFRADRIATLSPGKRQRWDQAVREYRERRRDLERVAREDWKLSMDGLGAIRLTRALERQRLESALSSASALLSNEVNETRERADTRDDAELVIAAGSDAWWAFLARQGAVRAARVAAIAPDNRAQTPAGGLAQIAIGLAQVLERFAREGALAGSLLRVTLPPELQTLDVHALQVDGRALVEWLPVGYAFELGWVPDSGAVDAARSSVVVFGDPNADLPRANAEARAAAERLPFARLMLQDQVTFEAFEQALPNAHLLHFAGHARAGGIDGLEGALALSHGQQLSVADVLVSERVPQVVVLSACTSSVAPEPGGGLSIGQAFLVAGSRMVVGASRAISDRLAARFAEGLYARLLAAGASRELPRDVHAWAVAMREASLEQARVDPQADWASVRLLLR